MTQFLILCFVRHYTSLQYKKPQIKSLWSFKLYPVIDAVLILKFSQCTCTLQHLYSSSKFDKDIEPSDNSLTQFMASNFNIKMYFFPVGMICIIGSIVTKIQEILIQEFGPLALIFISIYFLNQYSRPLIFLTWIFLSFRIHSLKYLTHWVAKI